MKNHIVCSALVFAALGSLLGCFDQSSDGALSDDVSDADADALSSLIPSTAKEDAARPLYTLRSRDVRGFYNNNGDSCDGGFDACSGSVVQLNGRRLVVDFGDGEAELSLIAKHGVIVFSSGTKLESNRDSCDSPGCANLVKISGVIFPVRRGASFVPQMKAKVVSQFAHPEFEGDRNGDFATTLRFDHE
jgi:hypothetical protein